MFNKENDEQLVERLDALSEYSTDIADLETRAKALKDLRDVIISGLVEAGVPSRSIAEVVGLSHVRVMAIANQKSSAA